MPGEWPLLSRERLGDFKVFTIRRDTLRSPRTGLPHAFYVLDGSDWVNVIALTPDGLVVLVRQYRVGTASETLEIPGGGVDSRDASALDAARRELREETGYEAPVWRQLGVVDPNPAVQSNVCTTFLAEGAVLTSPVEPDPGEDLSVELVAAAALPGLVRSGAIRHALVLAAFHWLDLHRAG